MNELSSVCIATSGDFFFFLQVCCPHLGMLFMHSMSQESISTLTAMDYSEFRAFM